MNVFARGWLRLKCRRSPALVGLDIGSDAVRLLQFTRTGERLQVSHYACEQLPAGAVVERRIDDVNAVGEAITRARKRSGIRVRHAAVALTAPAAMLRVVSVPGGLNEAELEARLELDAARILPASSLLHLDFEILGPLPDDPNRLQVLLAIAHVEPVRQCVATLKLGGLQAGIIDLEPLALARALLVLANQPLSLEQIIDQTTPLPHLANPLLDCILAPSVSAQAITKDAPALMLACGLALRGVAA